MILTPLQRRRAEKGLDVDNPDRKKGSGRFRLWSRGVVIYEIELALGKCIITISGPKLINPRSSNNYIHKLRILIF